MDLIKRFGVVFEGPDTVFHEGQVVCGHVTVELLQDMAIEAVELEFIGKAEVRWVRHDDVQSETGVAPSEEEQHLNQKCTLYRRDSEPDGRLVVEAGKSTFHFRVQLPYNLPSSFTGSHGAVKYWATAILERPWNPRKTTTREFSVISVVDLNMLPQAMRPLQCEGVKKMGFGCCLTGNIHCTWRLDRMGYVPGEKINLNGEINNNSRRKIRRSKATLVQNIRYNDSGGRSFHEHRVLSEVVKPAVLPGYIGFWREEIEVPPKLPPTGLKGCRLIDLWYTLKIKLYVAGLGDNLETSTDIIIASYGPDDDGASTVTESTMRSPFQTLSNITDGDDTILDSYFY